MGISSSTEQKASSPIGSPLPFHNNTSGSPPYPSPTVKASSPQNIVSVPIPNKVSPIHGSVGTPNARPRASTGLSDHEVNILMSPPSSPIRHSVDITSHFNSHQTVPTVFTWQGGGKDVYITGSFNNWKEKIPLNMSEKDFTIIQNLPPGTYTYKYVVDGKWVHSPDQPVSTDIKGNLNNFIEVKQRGLDQDNLSMGTLPHTPPGSYSQLNPEDDLLRAAPPSLPPHLRRALLNTTPSTEDPTLLPLPHHVMLNHLYSLPRKDNVTIFGVTHRYKTKFVTTVIYKPSTSVDSQFIEEIEL